MNDWLWLLVLYLLVYPCHSIPKLTSAIQATDEIIEKIRQRWDIDNFPYFLHSPSISQTSWEVMKIKYESKILESLIDFNRNVTFIISFMGSSVTAGHDSPFHHSYPIGTGKLLEIPFQSVGIQVIVRNVAIGNNPCLPYDACPKTFAGHDSDLIHWEQTYNCFPDKTNQHIYELFIRQSMQLSSHPIVIFSESTIPNYDEKDCENITQEKIITNREKRLRNLLFMSLVNISTSLHRIDKFSSWSSLSDLFSAYKTIGIQVWKHDDYMTNNYQCKGPYIAKWGCCSATWHPSLLGHELVASHFAYFWLLIFKDALQSVKAKIKNFDFIHSQKVMEKQRYEVIRRDETINQFKHLKSVLDRHITHELRHVPKTPLYPTKFIDGIQCYTTFLPHSESNYSLSNLILQHKPNINIENNHRKELFHIDIYENISKPEVINIAKQKGYQDFKYMIYGNNKSLPLNLKISVLHIGYSFLCQPPSNWAIHPNGFGNLWSLEPDIFLTKNVIILSNDSFFEFSLSKPNVMKLQYFRPNPEQELESICVEFVTPFPIGHHILTIIPKNETNIMISYLLIP